MDVVALGELLIDFTSQSVDADGYPTMAAHPGGAPANFLAALTKFGAKTALLGKVGNDAFGKALLNTLNNAGIETRGMVVSDEYFTTLAFVTLDESGDREFSFARKPGADTQITFEELDLSLIDAAKVFHLGTLSLTDMPAADTTRRAVCGQVPSLSGIAVKDTTGAGDIFGGSAVWKLLQTGQAPDSLTDAQLQDMVSFACTAAGLSTTKAGGISSVPDYQEVIRNRS